MEQIIPFNQGIAGTVPDSCLSNVRKGYGIAAKYNTAWEAWQNTQQHTDQDVPTGVDVPLYYSYTTTINGVTQNYGHINVRLANGTVWSDGNIYANIDAYLSNHAPKYVGWGESVNDVTVIKGDTGMQPTPKQVGDVYRFMTDSEISQKDLNFYITAPRTIYDLIYALGPNTQSKVKFSNQNQGVVELLTNERDTVLYPYVNAVSAALGLPAKADSTAATDAITALGNKSFKPYAGEQLYTEG